MVLICVLFFPLILDGCVLEDAWGQVKGLFSSAKEQLEETKQNIQEAAKEIEDTAKNLKNAVNQTKEAVDSIQGVFGGEENKNKK